MQQGDLEDNNRLFLEKYEFYKLHILEEYLQLNDQNKGADVG